MALTWPTDIIVNGIFIYVKEGSVGLLAKMNTINGVQVNVFNQTVATRSINTDFTTTEAGKEFILCNQNVLRL